MDGFTQSPIHSVVKFTHVDAQLFFAGAAERLNFSLHLEEM